MSDALQVIGGAILGYVLGWWQDVLRRRRERRAVASAILTELHMLAPVLHILAEPERAPIRGSQELLPAPVAERVPDWLPIFRFTETAALAMHFRDSLSRIRMLIVVMHEPGNDLDPQQSREMMSELASGALSTAGVLEDLLLREGGKALSEQTLKKSGAPLIRPGRPRMVGNDPT